MTAKFQVQKRDGKMSQASKEIFAEQWAALPDGDLDVQMSEAKAYRPTRYKWYFGHVLSEILNQAGHLLQITNTKTGEVRRMRNTTELHTFLKWKYNLVWVMVGDIAMPEAGTTTDLSDSEFIANFQERIMSDFAGPPWNVEFVDEDEWKSILEAGRRR